MSYGQWFTFSGVGTGLVLLGLGIRISAETGPVLSSCFVLRISRFVFRISRFVFRVLRFVFRATRFEFRVSYFAFQVSGFRGEDRACPCPGGAVRGFWGYRGTDFDFVFQ